MLELPHVTLILAETRAHELARRTAVDAISKIKFAEVIVYTDDPGKLAVPGARHVAVQDWKSMHECWVFGALESFKLSRTSHALFLEWDAGVVDAGMWRDEFLTYDYIGAPWWYTDGLNVGNGGFSLRSKRLTDFMAANRARWPAFTDNNLCRHYRREIEAAGGFRWAPEEVAHDFSFEGFAYRERRHFGFHSSENWPYVLDREELIARTRLTARAPDDGPHYRLGQLLDRAPWLKAHI